jgi:hypothetical protein
MNDSNNSLPSLLLIVPRAKSEACRHLHQTFDGSGVRVIVDRRDGRQPLRSTERRTGPEREAALAAGRWVVVRTDTAELDVHDADARAVLFLYCSQHPVPCERCQQTYRLGWLTRAEQALLCPRCSDDLTSVVVAHALRCRYWEPRRTRGVKAPVRVDAHPGAARTAAS